MTRPEYQRRALTVGDGIRIGFGIGFWVVAWTTAFWVVLLMAGVALGALTG